MLCNTCIKYDIQNEVCEIVKARLENMCTLKRSSVV
jgi:hypothetical protein